MLDHPESFVYICLCVFISCFVCYAKTRDEKSLDVRCVDIDVNKDKIYIL